MRAAGNQRVSVFPRRSASKNGDQRSHHQERKCAREREADESTVTTRAGPGAVCLTLDPAGMSRFLALLRVSGT